MKKKKKRKKKNEHLKIDRRLAKTEEQKICDTTKI